MNIPNVSKFPTVWTDEQLERDAQKALEEFVDRRLAEPGGNYQAHVLARKTAILALFKTLNGIDPEAPDPKLVRSILLDVKQFDALRYVTGPPVSEDDLGVLVTRDIRGISKRDIRQSDDIPANVLSLICRLADPIRFPWISARRAPTRRELRNAINATSVMHAAQALQTERRGHGKRVEQRLEKRLVELGFVKIVGGTKPSRSSKVASPQTSPAFPAKGRVIQPAHHPAYPHFYGECVVYGRKVDLLIALATGRMIALEAKDSSSGLNSTKRLLNDTAAKAKHYATEAGKNIISVALLSGVFRTADLQAAQGAGLYLVWAHEMDNFIEWIKTQTSE